MGRLPSLTSLRLLAAVAQHSSVSTAAAKLGITQSAASRRIAALESDLGVALLHRHRRGVDLTQAGERYVDAIGPSLTSIAQATEAIRAENGQGPLRLRVYSTFAARWLLTRLPDFQNRHPDIEVRLDTTVTPASFERDEVDLAIQFGNGSWPETTSLLLIGDMIEPVCTPDFAKQHGLSPGVSIPEGLRLLESRYRRADWHDWAAAANVTLEGVSFMRFPSSLLTYQAAIEGMGMAMGQSDFLSSELKEGTLVAPFARPLRRDLGYYLVAPRKPEPVHAGLFRRWIMRSAPSGSTAGPDV